MEGTIEVLVQNLINVSKEEISLIRGLDRDAGELQTTLEMIQGYLNDAEKKSITETAVKTWLKKLEAVAFDADNVLDEVKYHALSKKVKKMKTTKEKVVSFFSSFDRIARPLNMAHKIKQINEDFESLKQKASVLDLVSIFVNAPAPAAVPDAAFETDSFTLDPIFIGRDDDVPKLVEILTQSPDHGRMFSILPIVGMGGMGKTTLTRKLFNHQKIKSQFGSLIWVHVSQTFNPIILFQKILTTLTSQTEKIEIKEVVLEKLQKALKAKTYLLVLDDVWNEDVQKWEDFINPLSGVTSTKGNGIVISTRNTEVASTVKPLHIHQLNGLSDEDCWSIIKAKAFENGDVPSGFEAIGRKIAKRCQGLPLAANVVGGLLCSKSEDDWLSVQQKWIPDAEGKYISKILRLSFDNLSAPSLKKCFAYCSIFPKGEIVDKQELIELWMAEGFLQPDGRSDMESVGDKFVKVFLHNSLLIVAKRDDYGNVESCLMHDLVHDLASSVLGSSKVGDNNSDCINQVRYIRHEQDEDEDESSPIPKEVATHLRTLFFKGEISDTMFSDFMCLHSLTLTSLEIEELPSSIRKLIHLRNLDIWFTEIKYLPNWIGELHHLQTLRAETLDLRKLPSTLKYLINLRHLYIDDNVELPAEIGRLTSLQTLTHFEVGDKKGYQIKELGSLKNLKGKLSIRNLEKVHDKEEAVKANIFQKPNLIDLLFEWVEDREEGEINDESVLEGLQPHPNLNKLEIRWFKGKRFPSWSLKMAVREEPQGSWVALNKLMEIKLSWCKECEEIPTLGHLPNLKSLCLKGLSSVRSINSSFYGVETSIVFPALERLTLEYMLKLREWAEVDLPCEVKVFPQLEYLEINQCKRLMSAPCYFSSCLKQLKITTMESYMPLVTICGVKLMTLTELHIRGLGGLECLPDWLFHNNHNLSELTISECPKLRELPDGLDTLNSLKKLTIEDCPELKSIGNPCGGSLTSLEIRKCPKLRELPDGLNTLKSMEELIIEGCPDLKSIGNPGAGGGSWTSLRSLEIRECQGLTELPCEMVESSLETVSLVRLRSLKNLPRVLHCLTKADRLRELKIIEFPKLMATSSSSCCVESWSFRSLERLEIDVGMEWTRESSAAIKEIVDAILQGCCNSALTWLDLRGVEIWECVPESIQNFTALHGLVLHNFGVEELGEWFGNLSSLERLYLYSCKKLRRLPSVDAMLRLTKLQHLKIRDCPELRIDSKWRSNNFPDLSISVDGRSIHPSPQRMLQRLRQPCF